MICKLKYFQPIWGLRNIMHWNTYRSDVNYLNEVACSFGMVNPFCTILESPKSCFVDSPQSAESPQLPDWLNSSEPGGSTVKLEGDDFVLPSVLNWITSYERNPKDAGVKSIVSYIVDSDVDKISKVLKNHFKSPDAVVQALSSCKVNLSESLVEQILKRFSCEWIPCFGFFSWVKSQKGFEISPDLYNLMVDNLGKSKKFDLMWELVEEMHQLGGWVTFLTISKVVRRLARAGKYEDAREAFLRMEEFGLQKDTRAMNMLMDALVKEGSVEQAENVYLESKDHIAPTVQTFNVLVHGWCKTRQIEKAKKTISEMEKLGIDLDVVTFTPLVEAYCLEKDFRKVDATIKEMQQKGCPPNVVTYTVMMNAFGKAKELNKALDVYEKMKQNGCAPDSSFYSCLIHILSKAGRVKDSRDVFEDMLKQGFAPDVLTYNTMITIAAQNSEEENALLLLKKMGESHCVPNLNTYAPLLKMCCRLNRMKVLTFLLNHMFRNDVSIDLGTYSLLVRGLSRNGKLERACSFFEEALLRGFVPTSKMNENLVKELEKKGRDELKERVRELMAHVAQ